MCGAERTETRGEGFCRMPAGPVVARAGLHMWEEPVISGTRGSGTVFFSGCTLGCVFCQNHEISAQGVGKPVTVERLGEIFRELIRQGAHNINLVTPGHFAPWVAQALEPPLPVPVVCNTGGYERVETLRLLEGKVQVYLPDMKYALEEPARQLSGAGDYPAAARAAIREMFRQVGASGTCEGSPVRVLIRTWCCRDTGEHPPSSTGGGDLPPRGGAAFPDDFSIPPIPGAAGPGPARHLGRSIGGGVYGKSGIWDGFTQERTSARGIHPGLDLTGV